MPTASTTKPKTSPVSKPTEPVVHPNLAQALAAFQVNLPSLSKGSTAQVRSDKGSYSYDYATLADVSKAVIPALAAQGLAFTAIPTWSDGAFVLEYSLHHGESGQTIDGFWPLPDPSRTPAQQVGSAITYARRYALTAVTGVSPDDDSDDDGAAAGHAAQSHRQPQAPRQAQQARPQAPAEAPPLEYLPAGIYDLAGITSPQDAEQMFYTARAAGHLPLMLREGDQDIPLGEWLRRTAASLADIDPDAAAVAAHERQLADQAAMTDAIGPDQGQHDQ